MISSVFFESLEVAVEKIGLIEELGSPIVLKLVLSCFFVVSCHLSRKMFFLNVEFEG